MTQTLKPCPICGSGDESVCLANAPHGPWDDCWHISCECSCEVHGRDREALIEHWNTRAALPDPAADEEDALREALTTISSQAICYGMRASETELRDWLKFISETAEQALATAGGDNRSCGSASSRG